MKKLSRKDLKMIKGSGANITCSVDLKCPSGQICCFQVCYKTTEMEHLPNCEGI